LIEPIIIATHPLAPVLLCDSERALRYDMTIRSFVAIALLASTAAAQVPSPSAAAPELFAPGVVSTDLDALNAAFTPDGDELYFSINSPENAMGTILVTKRHGARWSTPMVVSFSGRYSDYDPVIAHDGKQLLFISNRPVDGQPKPFSDYDIWSVDRTATGWGEPHNLGAPINTSAPEYSPSVAADGTLYFSSRRADSQGRFNIYRSRFVDGKYAEPENLGPTINGTFNNIDTAIASDQSFVIFVSYNRPEGLGGGDLYVSFNHGGQWTPPKNLDAPINSSALEYAPALSPDGQYLYFTSKRGFTTNLTRGLTFDELRDSLRSRHNGTGKVYRVPLAPLLTIASR
jgi:Tol biopolymer transport system component